jgi:pyruvate/2-oxoglutarate/acetoin dehydrogenase E1 component
MLGLATGLSLENYLPIVYIERFDFILNALDAIVNHLDKIDKMSYGEFKPKVLIKVAIGIKNKPLYSGLTHTQDFTEAMKKLITFPVIKLIKTKQFILYTYDLINTYDKSIMIIEEKELYDEQV